MGIKTIMHEYGVSKASISNWTKQFREECQKNEEAQADYDFTFGFVLALYCKNIFVILTGPFMYSILENFVLAILRLERLRLVVAFDPTTVDPKVVSISSFLFGPIVLSIVIGLTAFLLSKKNAIVTI